jgi:hypothetical protein
VGFVTVPLAISTRRSMPRMERCETPNTAAENGE